MSFHIVTIERGGITPTDLDVLRAHLDDLPDQSQLAHLFAGLIQAGEGGHGIAVFATAPAPLYGTPYRG